jgi:hypothetical protein
MQTKITLRDALTKAGIENYVREIDLHCESNAVSRAILADYGLKIDGWNVQPYKNEINGKPWYDIPFRAVW